MALFRTSVVRIPLLVAIRRVCTQFRLRELSCPDQIAVLTPSSTTTITSVLASTTPSATTTPTPSASTPNYLALGIGLSVGIPFSLGLTGLPFTSLGNCRSTTTIERTLPRLTKVQFLTIQNLKASRSAGASWCTSPKPVWGEMSCYGIEG